MAKPKVRFNTPTRYASKKSSGSINTAARYPTSKKPGSGKITSVVRPKKVLKLKPPTLFGTVDAREAPKQALAPAPKSKVQGGAGVKSPAPKSKVQAVNDGGKTPDAGRPVNPMGG